MSDLCPTCSNDPCICEKDAAIEQPQDVVINTFDNLAGRPDSATIESWKATYGEINLLGLSEDEMYIYRTVPRLEFKNLSSTAKDEDSFAEMLVQRCVLWPKLGLEFNVASKGGTIGCLKEAILQTSNFLDPRVVMSLVRKL